ncbi:MAG TPA: hypothetical protein PL151_11625 [Phycisphaerae bacterium]|nr:hypothetical protein [Phycisphaerae bacterium]HOJ73501.1 hypothetical protein [Phycisphaerae bacterium]HOM51691.1 hypothetical protein [Phycisphaerae bacterium]HON66151.1 hypothetical protein [Phycisphaerae bacterium]HOQ86288.1 hypothetical protein [Phycisphaerae bacterium]
MIRWAILFVVVASTFALTGCGDGMAITRRERAERHRQVLDIDARQFNDDWDLLWLNEDTSSLSPWRTRSWP